MIASMSALELFLQLAGWYLVVQLMTLAALPLAHRWLGTLPDGGWSAARPLGILLTSLLFWLGWSFGLLTNNAGGAAAGLLLLAALSWAAGRQALPELGRRLQRQRSGIVWQEVIFIAGFLLWGLVRAYDPAANHTEKPMDLMFMNSLRASVDFPPQDAWMAGQPISYYYLGYWLLHTIGLLTGQSAGVAYTVGQAAWFGLLCAGSFGLLWNLLRADGRSSVTAALGGVVGTLTIALAGNVQGILEWLHANGYDVTGPAAWFGVRNFPENALVTNQWYIGNDWWWWRASRVVSDLTLAGDHIEIIDEFPAFSYILGDNHPHVLAMPVAILLLLVALAVFQHRPVYRPEMNFWQRLRATTPLGGPGLVLLAATAGAPLFLNTWDLPPYWLLLGLAHFVAALRGLGATPLPSNGGDALSPASPDWKQAAALALGVLAIMAAGAGVLYLPYLLTAKSQAQGIGVNLFNPTRFGQFVAMWGIYLLGLGSLLLVAWRRIKPSLAGIGLWLAAALLTAAVLMGAAFVAAFRLGIAAEGIAAMPLGSAFANHEAGFLARWGSQWQAALLAIIFLGLVVGLAWSALRRHITQPDNDAANQTLFFVLLVALAGLVMIALPEFIFLRDNFGNRMNTVFKFYYQGWLLLGVAVAFGIVSALADRRWAAMVPAVAALLLLSVSTIYLLAGAYGKAGSFERSDPTLDASAYLLQWGGDEAAAVAWVQENTMPGDIVAEATGDSYRAEHNRISTMTGRPTVLGWGGHESQWRGKSYGDLAAGRTEALEIIYRSGGADDIRAALARWKIDYVYIGPVERERFGVNEFSESRFAGVMDLAFAAGPVKIYRVR